MIRAEPERASEAIWAADEDASPQTRPVVATVGSDRVELAPGGERIAPAGRFGSWHLPAGRTLSATCKILNNRGVNYVVLPAVTGGQPALLVSDDDVPRIKDLITRVPFGEQLPVYATTGLPGFSFQQHWRQISDATSMAVLPTYLAESLLARATVDKRGCRTLAAADKLPWIIYCALYLSGNDQFASISSTSPVLAGPSTRIIGELARETGANLAEPFTLESLDRYLSDAGWEPPFDVLKRLSPWNQWAAAKVRLRDTVQACEEPGMVAFFIRRALVDTGMDADISKIIESGGFEVLKSIDLNEEQIEAAAKVMRGGNWGPGAFSVSGGPPVRILIAFDVAPAPVPDEFRRKYPHLENGHILEAKLRCREFVEDRLPRKRRFNPVHSTDDSAHSWEVVRLFAADGERALRETIELRKAEFATRFEVVRSLTRTGLRSKIEVIRYGCGQAVIKTFRHNCLRFMEREAAFMDAFSPHRSEISPVLERGPNYLVMPYIKGQPLRRFLFGRGFPRLMTLRQVRQIADLLRFLFAHSYDPVDLGPHNLLVDEFGHLKAIDFEFVHLSGGPVDPQRSACLNGIPEGFEGEWPPKALWAPQRAKCLDPWRLRWFGCTGLTLQSFLHDPPSLQRVKRLVNYPTYIASKMAEHQTLWLRKNVKHVLRRRLPVLTRMAAQAVRLRTARS